MIDLIILTLILIVPPLVGLGITIITRGNEDDAKSTEATAGNNGAMPIASAAGTGDLRQDAADRRGGRQILPRAICWKGVCVAGHSRGLRWMRLCV